MERKGRVFWRRDTEGALTEEERNWHDSRRVCGQCSTAERETEMHNFGYKSRIL